jgi:DNA-binding transcriptional LysR family regulator
MAPDPFEYRFSDVSVRFFEVNIEGLGINRKSEFIPTELLLSAVVLAEELDFSAAAQRLGTSPATLHAQIGELAARLECSLFQETGDCVEVTKDGQVLIDGFRSLLAQNGKLPE